MPLSYIGAPLPFYLSYSPEARADLNSVVPTLSKDRFESSRITETKAGLKSQEAISFTVGL